MIISTQKAVEFAKHALQLAWDGNLPVKPDVIAQGLVIFRKDETTGDSKNIPIKVRALNSQTLNASGQASLENTENGYVFSVTTTQKKSVIGTGSRSLTSWDMSYWVT